MKYQLNQPSNRSDKDAYAKKDSYLQIKNPKYKREKICKKLCVERISYETWTVAERDRKKLEATETPELEEKNKIWANRNEKQLRLKQPGERKIFC